jgi:cytochrome o ubiquinol oxidase subunit 2
MKTKFRKQKLLFIGLIIVDLILLIIVFGQILHWSPNFQLFNPAGPVAAGQKRLIIEAVSIMLIAVIPILGAAFFVMFKYREGKQQKYDPEWNARNSKWQIGGWIFLTIIIICLAVVGYNGAQNLDPYKAIASANPPLTIQVVALQWKWLFIYPQQNIATVNFIEFPVNTPVHFELTADGPMSAFWIPQLGSQIYAMAAMQTQLNLMASKAGEYNGLDTEINGDGYAGMKFIAKAGSQQDFNNWVESVKKTGNPLDQNTYNLLAMPSQNNSTVFYSPVDENLYNNVMMNYMMPASQMPRMDMK